MKLFCAKSRLLNISFFCILFSVFLNTFSFAQTNGTLKKKFIQPLVLSDYNNGTLYTNLGGLSGGDEEKPGETFTTMIRDDGFTRGNSGYSLKLDYDVSRLGEFSFYWIKLGKELRLGSGVTERLDLRKYDYLSFWIKGAQDEGNIKVELHQDSDDNGIFTFGKDIKIGRAHV